MEFYEVLERRRTIRDFSDKIVTDEVLEKILSAAFKAPTNDHLRQFEFIVVRGRENIARLVAPVTENTRNIQQAGLEAAEALCRPTDQSSLNYFASAWAAVENILLAATAEGLSCAFRIPIGNEPEHVKRLVGAPEEYEFTCFLAVGYAAENAHVCRQKEIRKADRIHRNVW